MRDKIVILVSICCIVTGFTVKAQDQEILIPKPLYWSPMEVDDSTDLFGKAWRFYRDGYQSKEFHLQ